MGRIPCVLSAFVGVTLLRPPPLHKIAPCFTSKFDSSPPCIGMPNLGGLRHRGAERRYGGGSRMPLMAYEAKKEKEKKNAINAPVRTEGWEDAMFSAPGGNILDVRSPSEFEEDHAPGAINCPVLSDEERAIVGTVYKDNPFEARKVGAALVATNLAKIIREVVHDKPKDWRPLVYCWRGGQRSGSLAQVLSNIGFRTHVLHGGYMKYREDVRKSLEEIGSKLTFRVISGPTGSGKTLLLRDMMDKGWQCLDLEGLAKHRGSVLGDVEGGQPSQKMFETVLVEAMKRFDTDKPVWVESESHTVGNLHVPPSIFNSMRKAPRFELKVPTEQRVKYTLKTYEETGWLVDQTDDLVCLLTHLTAIRGKAKVAEWIEMAKAKEGERLVADLLETHYDPSYARSQKSHMEKFKPTKRVIPLESVSREHLNRDWYAAVDEAGTIEEADAEPKES